ncbi:MAG: hypothetical protein ABI222_11085 [Opitutaceae bacterium]
MATRLLSFLTDIEKALLNDPNAQPGASWDCQRMVNFKDGLARMTLARQPSNGGAGVLGGSILVQTFLLADGSMSLKAILNWDGSASGVALAVQAKPAPDWVAEARQIASTWLRGPSAITAIDSEPIASTRSGLKTAIG